MTKPDPADTLMEDDPGIYQDLLSERDEAMQKLERVQNLVAGAEQRAQEAQAENERLRADGEHGARELLRLNAENERLRAEVNAWPVTAESYHEFINELCENIPEEWEDDVAAEAIILNYVRHLESLVAPEARLP